MKRNKRHWVSVGMVALTLGALLGYVIAFDLKPKLGLDLRGGLSVTLTAPDGTRDDVLDKTVAVLRNRIDTAGVAEPEISREGGTNVFIQLPGTEDPERLLRLIGQTAQLQFRQVLEVIPEPDGAFATTTVSTNINPDEEIIASDEEKTTKFRLAKAEVTGDEVRRATAATNTQSAAIEVRLVFKKEGSKRWEALTGRLACLQGPTRQVAIVLDGVVESAPQVGEEVQCNVGITGGTTSITGGFDDKEANDLAVVLSTGALPVQLEQSEVRTVSATLGDESLRAGLLAGGIGLALVFLYVLVYYRTLGFQTWIGLGLFGAAIYGLTVVFGKLIGWNLTLAGIAGLLVSVGIATDSYIVFFERVKEELHAHKTLRASIDKGFGHAWRTMRTANFVTILAALVLYFLAVGPVRGFALALGLATALDLLLTYTLTWPLASLLATNKRFAEGRFIGMRRALEGGRRAKSVLTKIYRSEFNIDFIGRRRLWFGISAALMAVSALALVPAIKGLEFGIDFRGGTIYRAPIDRQVSVDAVKRALEGAGLANAVVQIETAAISNQSRVQVQTEASQSLDKRQATLDALSKVTGAQARDIDSESVGAKWGAQITTKATRGLFIFLVLVVLYMSYRLEAKMAAAGIIALLHDLLITAGIYALVGFEVSPATVIATLTILGFSLYDTVVVFDKIKENAGLPAFMRSDFKSIANASSNQVLMRSINTSLTVLLPVGSLLFVGSGLLSADTLKDLSLALFIGIAAGTFSSIFVATPILSVWKQREARFSARTPEKAVEQDGDESEEDEPVAVVHGPRRAPPPVTYERVQRKRQSRARRKSRGR